MSELPLRVLKFGGTSVQDADRIKKVVELTADGIDGYRTIVVVSALGGITNRLIDAINEALARTGKHETVLAEIKRRHAEATEALVKPAERASVTLTLDAVWKELSDLLDGVFLIRECTPRTWDAIISTGERASIPLVAAAFRSEGYPATALDATSFIRTDDNFTDANVDFKVTNSLVRETFSGVPGDFIAVVTGFIASTEGGVTTTLGRSGSDYTATILAASLDAHQVIIWTDVDGVLSADPRLVRNAFSLERLNYWEAGELAYFGAKVLHPRTMRPLQQKSIPLLIKNTLNSSAPGTLISTETSHLEGHVKAVTSIKNMALVTIEGSGIMGVPGVAARGLSALASRKINVLMISQASSEQSICFIVQESERYLAVRLLEQAFELERQRGDVTGVRVNADVAVVAVVGENMRNRPGIAGRLFSTLGRSSINVLTIAQGSSERNISVAISQHDVKRAVKALHDAFPLARNRANIFVFGAGNVGRALLRAIHRQRDVLSRRSRLDLHVVGIADSKYVLWDEDGLDLEEASERLETGAACYLDEVLDLLRKSHLERLIAVDVTASEEVAAQYQVLLESGISVVTANKIQPAGPMATYQALHQAANRAGVPFFYEATVGAGLPVVSTIRDLIRSGDEIRRIEAVISGTLAFLFNRLAEGHRFSDALLEARNSGYTEPDPREDLSGADIVRKMVILARETGVEIERSDVAMEALLPDEYRHMPVSEFMSRLHELDGFWDERVGRHARAGTPVHFVGRCLDGTVDVGLTPLDRRSPFASLHGTENMVVIHSARYRETPLVVRGPGAGGDVTAGGVFADIIRAAELLL